MLDTEYNEAEVKELFKEEGREEGNCHCSAKRDGIGGVKIVCRKKR